MGAPGRRHVDADDAAPGHTTSITAQAGPLRGTEVAAAEIPSLDEVPALAVAAAVAEGTTVFSDVGELRVKEVDRLAAVVDLVRGLRGQRRRVDGDTLPITGVGPRAAARAPGSTAGATTAWPWRRPSPPWRPAPGERSLITGFDAVETSYPAFADDLRRLTAADGPLAPRRWSIAIDGPAGAGKSTVSTAVAARLGLERLDTGAMYRAVAALALSRGIAPDDEPAVAALAAAADH